jgi:NDP-sugar pyrophosphorylase family protein
VARSAAFWPCAHPLTFHLVELDASGNVERVRASADSDIWTNAGYFVFTNRIIDYIKEGEELVIEPFQRLITKGNCSPTATTVFSRPWTR